MIMSSSIIFSFPVILLGQAIFSVKILGNIELVGQSVTESVGTIGNLNFEQRDPTGREDKIEGCK